METVQPHSTQVGEYVQSEAALAVLREKYAGAKFDVTTRDGMKAARAARLELVKLRTTLEAKRVEIKAPLLKQTRLIDDEAKRITGELLKLEAPIDEQIQAEECKQEEARQAAVKAEEERVAKITRRIADIAKVPVLMAGKPASDLGIAIADLKADRLEWAQEHVDDARLVTATTVAQLEQMHAAAIAAVEEAKRQAEERARLDAERAELARQQAAQREAEEKARREREEAERVAKQKIEAEERAARERIEAESRAARARMEEEERKAKAVRDAEETRLKAERDKLEAAQRAAEEDRLRKQREEEARAAAARREQEERERAERLAKEEAERKAREEEQRRLDAYALLKRFVELAGDREEFATVAADIKEFLVDAPAEAVA
jgi:colicin import membrane protein